MSKDIVPAAAVLAPSAGIGVFRGGVIFLGLPHAVHFGVADEVFLLLVHRRPFLHCFNTATMRQSFTVGADGFFITDLLAAQFAKRLTE